MNGGVKVGLTVGKFDPPHRGHSLLFDVAMGHVDRLIVLVYDFARQTAPASVRARWMQENHPDVDFRVIPNPEPSRRFETQTYGPLAREFLGDIKIDMVITSEPYGDSLAKFFGAQWHSVDRDRSLIPVSSTMIRRNPLPHLSFLHPNVRAHYVKRVTVVGSESTGKTSICEYLAQYFGTSWVPEYGREYTLEKLKNKNAVRWSSDEFFHIAREQQRIEDEAARSANRVLFCDTDAFATSIWHERYMGHDVEHWPVGESKTDLYFIPYPDVPFVVDAIRDSEHLRFWMYERFVDEFKRRGRRYQVLEGDYDERRAQAVAAVETLLAEPPPPSY